MIFNENTLANMTKIGVGMILLKVTWDLPTEIHYQEYGYYSEIYVDTVSKIYDFAGKMKDKNASILNQNLMNQNFWNNVKSKIKNWMVACQKLVQKQTTQVPNIS